MKKKYITLSGAVKSAYGEKALDSLRENPVFIELSILYLKTPVKSPWRDVFVLCCRPENVSHDI
jgi:hypothetical protein